MDLLSKICSPKNLRDAFRRVETNNGCPGIDGETIEEFRFFLEGNLEDLAGQLQEGSYRPQPLRRVALPKPGTNETRPLGIPTVQDRVVQAALLQVLEPLFEPRFAGNSYGFRPSRGAKGALRQVATLIKAGCRWVVEADIQKFFDSVPHAPLLDLVGAEVEDDRILGLIRLFLQSGVMEDGVASWTPGLGTPQGGVISPLLANIYLNPLDHLMVAQGHELVRYADDFVVLCHNGDEAEAALAMGREWMGTAGLSLHPDKTRLVDLTGPGGFDFLGYHLELDRCWPREKSIRTLKEAIWEKTRRRRRGSLPEIIPEVNEVLTGWFEYFRHSTEPEPFQELDGWVASRLRRLRRVRRGVGKPLALHYWPDPYFTDQGLFSLAGAHSGTSRSWD
jgi:RNA-directed DNA polymerase